MEKSTSILRNLAAAAAVPALLLALAGPVQSEESISQHTDQLRTIVTAERLRRTQQPGLLDHVRRLQSEFEDGS